MELSPSERIRTIQEVARRLDEDESWADARLTLEEFGVTILDPEHYEFGSGYEYLSQCARRATDETLIALRAHLDPSEEGPAPTEESRDVPGPGHWRDGYFRLFISHTHSNKKLAKAIREILLDYGIAGFVAHSDIEPTAEWRDEIEVALATCDALVAIVTEDFIGSKWCDQEVGFVVGRNKLVVPVRQNADPHGFIEKYQALQGDAGQFAAEAIAERIRETLEAHDLTRAAVASATVTRYAESHSFDDARTNLRRVREIAAELWTPRMLERAETAGRQNVNLSDGDDYGTPIPRSLSRHLSELVGRDEPADTGGIPSSAGTSDFGAPSGGSDDDIPF